MQGAVVIKPDGDYVVKQGEEEPGWWWRGSGIITMDGREPWRD